MGMGTESGSVP
uniref:Uncharacterized protein n=1 Tax=Nymphaea colorata TaxID=210225 RepID=A0A5K1GGJ4_9MAGN